MERAKKIVEELRRQAVGVTEQDILNTLREYLQTLALKALYQSKFGNALSFMGGTALRICHNLKRYSEDLDFALDEPTKTYRFAAAMEHIAKEMRLHGFDVAFNFQEDKIVQKGFLRIANLATAFDLKSFAKTQKFHIKLEVDARPIPLEKGERESFFVDRFQEIFPILKHTLPTLFAGKVLAIFYRPYTRGRDFYDLIWYLSQKVALNLDYLNRGVKGKPFKNLDEVFAALDKKVQLVKPSLLFKDVGRFLEDPSEKSWIDQYQLLYQQKRNLG